jgi:hypothetical protein
MKIQVVRVDGGTETINLVGSVIANEPGSELEFPRNQSPIHVEATGMDYFFREDGKYDGWGMTCAIPCDGISDGDLIPKEAMVLIKAIESDREIYPPQDKK